MKIVPFNPKHLEHIELIDAQQHAYEMMRDNAYQNLLTNEMSYTVLHDGKVIACGGVFMMMPHMGRAWALMSKHSGPHMRYLTKTVRRYLFMLDLPRVDTLVLSHYDKGKRWLDLLGFVNETPNGMPEYGHDGSTYDQYRWGKYEYNRGR